MALIGKNNRQSVLDENASLFQIQEDKSEKQKWKEMDKTQKLQYFTDYYLVKCIICIAAAAAGCLFIWNILKPQKEQLLFLAVVQNSLVPEEKANLEQAVSDLLISDPKNQEIRIDDTFPSGYESDAKLSAYLAAQEIDLIITNENHFQNLAERGIFEDLNTVMPEFAKEHAGLLYWTDGCSEENSDTETKAYGIDITGSEILKDSWYSDEKAMIGLTINSPQKENAILVFTDLFFN